MRPFHAINNLQEQPEHNPAEQGFPGSRQTNSTEASIKLRMAAKGDVGIN
jgi:hypothetical protein